MGKRYREEQRRGRREREKEGGEKGREKDEEACVPDFSSWIRQCVCVYVTMVHCSRGMPANALGCVGFDVKAGGHLYRPTVHIITHDSRVLASQSDNAAFMYPPRDQTVIQCDRVDLITTLSPTQ